MTANNLDERAQTRFDSRITILIETLAALPDNTSPGKVIISHTLSVSDGGLRVVLDEAIAVGNIVRICLDMKDQEPIFVVGEVRWQQPDLETDGVLIGFSIFEAEDTDIEVWKLAIKNIQPLLPEGAHSQ